MRSSDRSSRAFRERAQSVATADRVHILRAMSGILERIAARLRPRPAVASANPAWDELVAHRNAAIFEPPGDVDFAACRRIDAAFDAVLAQYAIPRDEFYSGSIKERDAAALHALVRKRGPRTGMLRTNERPKS